MRAENNIEISKNKILKRILQNSEVFQEDELYRKNIQELIQIQENTLIGLRIKIKFNRRHKSNQTIAINSK